MIAMVLILGSLVCNRTEAAPWVERAQVALDDKTQAEGELATLREREAYFAEQIRLERANAAGVVSLRDLHEWGQLLQETRTEIAQDVARQSADKKIVTESLAKAHALLAGCGR